MSYPERAEVRFHHSVEIQHLGIFISIYYLVNIQLHYTIKVGVQWHMNFEFISLNSRK